MKNTTTLDKQQHKTLNICYCWRTRNKNYSVKVDFTSSKNAFRVYEVMQVKLHTHKPPWRKLFVWTSTLAAADPSCVATPKVGWSSLASCFTLAFLDIIHLDT